MTDRKAKKKDGTKAVYADIPADLHAAFYAEVEKRGMKVHKAIEFALREWVEGRETLRTIGKRRESGR